MNSEIRDFVMNHPLFSHHDHHCPFKTFEENRLDYDAASLLGYAHADIDTAAGTKALKQSSARERIACIFRSHSAADSMNIRPPIPVAFGH